MEARKITIVSTKTQKKSVIMSSATTLAELKADLSANDIDYEGMTFYEGTSKTELKTDESVLPTNVPYKGTITNELVFMLTNTNKKIKSGANVASRTEAYANIKKLGLQAQCVEKFGKNFTMCKTADLVALVSENTPKTVVKKVLPKKVVPASAPVTPKETKPCNCPEAITKLVKALVGNYISFKTANDVLSEIGKHVDTPKVNTKKSSYSDSEIDDMFKDVC